MRGEMKEGNKSSRSKIISSHEKTDSFHALPFPQCWARTEILAIFFGLSWDWKNYTSADP